jgi:quinol monooxygenase YgiN
MYGLIGRMAAVTGQRDALIGILLEGVRNMPGCLSYVVFESLRFASCQPWPTAR